MVLGLGVALIAVGCAAPARSVAFNQDYIESIRDGRLARAASMEPTGPLDGSVDFEDPLSILRSVLRNAPGKAVVYPTETYYYYRLYAGPRLVSGNLRLLDAGIGVLHMGYFDAHEPWRTRAASLSGADGVVVTPAGERSYRVAFEGRSVVFTLSGQSGAHPRRSPLTENEELVSAIWDESGVRFWLVYNNSLNSFYYVLDEDVPLTEPLATIPTLPGLEVGLRTGFVLYHDTGAGRRLLVGVRQRSVRDNDYFDGPFDQVPPRLPIKERLEAAYPYVKLRGGIDAHGNFVEQPGVRVAISPYAEYTDLDEFASLLGQRLDLIERAHGTAADRWLTLTYDSKRDFHRHLEARAGAHVIYVSQGWPANHLGVTSYQWPDRHAADQSAAWAPNHQADLSGSTRDP
ncbi:MAG: hypothetical protein IT437_14175 [Phycisphaerales bacterium]|nr:hypothetical protein [Phycisphaerales bacterium]